MFNDSNSRAWEDDRVMRLIRPCSAAYSGSWFAAMRIEEHCLALPILNGSMPALAPSGWQGACYSSIAAPIEAPTVRKQMLWRQGGPTLEPSANLAAELGRTESLGSRREAGAQPDPDDTAPAESRAPSLRRSSFVAGSAHGRDRGLLMLHEVRLRATC